MPIGMLGLWATFAGYGCWIASIKRRSPAEGIALGLFLGPIGCLVEATLRERSAAEVEEERVRQTEEAQARSEEERERRDASRAEAARRRIEARARSEAARVRRAESFARFSSWFDEAVLKFGWYEALPEVAQPIVVGTLLALPVVVGLILILKGR
jgi:hypothetical protein